MSYFRDEAMRAFEKNALQQSEGDPSLIFKSMVG